jgi:hypothetical protein
MSGESPTMAGPEEPPPLERVEPVFAVPLNSTENIQHLTENAPHLAENVPLRRAADVDVVSRFEFQSFLILC